MPTFPPYNGQLPPQLNPLNLRHLFLLAYWVFFRPTALKSYLYQADPALYRSRPGTAIFGTWHVPAYRGLLATIPLLTLILAALTGLVGGLSAALVRGAPFSWQAWGLGVAIGLAVCVALALGVAMLNGIALGAAFGVVSATAAAITIGVTVAAAVSLENNPVTGVAVGAFLGVALCVAFALPGGVIGGVQGALGNGLVAISALAAVILSASSWLDGLVGTLVLLGAGVLALARVLFYPFELVLALRSGNQPGRHPVEWDELLVLPLPGVQALLAHRLEQGEEAGLRLVADIVENPFLSWKAQRVMQHYLHSQPRPLHLIYRLLASPELDRYIFTPLSARDWEALPTSRVVLLCELNDRWIDRSSYTTVSLVFRLLWWLTLGLRDRRDTALTRLAGMLYELLDARAVAAPGFDLARYRAVFGDLAGYQGGEEIGDSFETLTAFVGYSALDELPAAAEVVIRAGAEPIRPAVLAALAQLGQIGGEVATYLAATSRVNKLAALARVNDALDRLDDTLVAEVAAPEQLILRRVVRQWRRLSSEAGGVVGRAAVAGPITNPYVAGNPVIGVLFVGRDDIMRRLEELWGHEGQCPSIVLYGHRRMGKSSILHNLGAGARFGAQTVVVDFNMQRVGMVISTADLLYGMALGIYDALPESVRAQLAEPAEERFTAHNPYTTFDRFLRQVDQVRGSTRCIITVDEFELIEKLIEEQRLEPRLLDFWRGVIQTYPWFVMAFAGLHTLQEMTRDYWNPLFGSVTAIAVSFLSREATQRLVTQPSADFALDYSPEAVELIYALTNGQPYLTQLICHTLVTRYNRQAFEEGVARERRFSVADVEAVIGAAEFYRDGDAYFTGIWRHAATSGPAAQGEILRALAREPGAVPFDALVPATGNVPDATEQALESLQRRDVVRQTPEGWSFTVELMRRWMVEHEQVGSNS